MKTPETFDVPIKTWIHPDVFRALHQLAMERGTTVSLLVAIAARQAVTPRPPTRKWVRMTPERFERLCALAKTDLTLKQIAVELGVSPATVNNHIQRARSQS